MLSRRSLFNELDVDGLEEAHEIDHEQEVAVDKEAPGMKKTSRKTVTPI